MWAGLGLLRLAKRPQLEPTKTTNTPLTKNNNNDDDKQPEVGRTILSTCFRYIPRGLVTQFMDSLNSPAGLSTVDGAFRYCDPKVLRHVGTPVLGISGDWDLFCPAPGGLRTVQQFGGAHRQFIFLGPAYGTVRSRDANTPFCLGRERGRSPWADELPLRLSNA